MTTHMHSKGDLIEGRYKIIAFTGEGGMQEVYKARDRVLDRDVAVKVPKNKSAEKRFKRSAVLSAKVNHPNVAKTLDFIQQDDAEYLIEEFVEGDNLHNRFTKDFYLLDPYMTSHVIHHLAKGVAASHHVGVVHRDLKPSNIMVSNEANPVVIKITDFGIAKMAEEELAEAVAGGDRSITGSLTMMGALPYMSPEMIEAPKNADEKTDIWALGAILFELMTGDKPFGTGLAAVPKIVACKIPRKPSVLSKGPQFEALNNELWALIQKCLVKDRAKRLAADELVDACSQLCYPVEPREFGIVKEYKTGPGSWGFVSTNDGLDAFFHINSYYGHRPKLGERVAFARFPGRPSSRAHPVLPLRPLE